MPGRHNLKLWRGNSNAFSIGFKNESGEPVDITGAEIILRADWGDGSLRMTSADSGIEIIRAIDGVVEFAVGTTETRLMPGDRSFPYEIEMRKDGVETTLMVGSVSVIGGTNDDA